jgi:outer membrane protein
MADRFWKQQGTGILALLVSLLAIGFHFQKKSLKIGYAETTVLMAEFSESVEAKAQFRKSQDEWDANLKRINDSLTAAMNVLKANFDKVPPKERETLERNLARWNHDLQRYTQAVKRMSEEKEKELLAPVLNKMNAFMKTWGEDHGFDMIFGTASGGNILQASSALNLTQDLLRDMNAFHRRLPSAADTASHPPSVNTGSPKP